MKKIVFIAFAICMALSATAQKNVHRAPARAINPSPEERAFWQTQSLNQVLQLDSVQFQAIFLMNYADIMAGDSISAQRKAGPEKRVRPTDEERKMRREAMVKRREMREQQMKQILTEEQYKKYVEQMKEMRKNARPMRQRRGERPGSVPEPGAEPEFKE